MQVTFARISVFFCFFWFFLNFLVFVFSMFLFNFIPFLAHHTHREEGSSRDQISFVRWHCRGSFAHSHSSLRSTENPPAGDVFLSLFLFPSATFPTCVLYLSSFPPPPSPLLFFLSLLPSSVFLSLSRSLPLFHSLLSFYLISLLFQTQHYLGGQQYTGIAQVSERRERERREKERERRRRRGVKKTEK